MYDRGGPGGRGNARFRTPVSPVRWLPLGTAATLQLYQSAAGIYGLSFFLALVAFLRRAQDLARVASGVLVAGLCLHLLVFLGDFRHEGALVLITPLAITSAYVFFSLLGGYLLALAYGLRASLCVLFALPLTVALGSLSIDPAFSPFAARLQGPWIQLHLVLLVLSYAAFTAASGTGLMLVVRARSLKSKAQGFLAESLPPQVTLDQATMVATRVGFWLLTASILAAATHARTVGWVATGKPGKAVLAMLVWGYYGALTVGRRLGRWRGERVGWLAFFGVLFAFGSFGAIEAVTRGRP